MIAVTAAAVMLIFTNGGASGRMATPAVVHFQTMDDCKWAKGMVEIEAAINTDGEELLVVCLSTGAQS